MRSPGLRVGAILKATEGTVEFLGYGTYEGDFVPGEAVGMFADAMRENKMTNPKINLDSGKVVYGCECWWGSAEEVDKQLKLYKEVVNVDIDEVRKNWKD